MTREERNIKLKHFITCLKCEESGRECDANCHVQYEVGNMGEIIENLEAISKALEQEPKWIPISERLPKIADVYRVTRYYPNNVMNPTYLIDACFFDGSNTWYNDNRINHERNYVDNIIAWQENPEPYKGESEEV